jgi:predicted transcriptional regulator
VTVKKVKVGIKDIKTALNEFVETGEAVKKEVGVHFTSFEAFRKALTPKRLELLHVIKMEKPSSINRLSKIVGRNIKNVAEDVKYLAQIGLVKRRETDKEVIPFVGYEKISLEIVV